MVDQGASWLSGSPTLFVSMSFLTVLRCASAAPGSYKAATDGWTGPPAGLYFFCESGETRSETGRECRIVRVGTHGLSSSSQSTLWGRLSQHRGSSRSGLGNHRGSIFRLLVGVALGKRMNIPLPDSWGFAVSRGEAARRLNVDRVAMNEAEAGIEARVSEYIGRMPFLWLNVNDARGPNSNRSVIERNAIALLSSYRSPAADGPSTDWLGHYSNRERDACLGFGTTTTLMPRTTHLFSMRWNRGLSRLVPHSCVVEL